MASLFYYVSDYSTATDPLGAADSDAVTFHGTLVIDYSTTLTTANTSMTFTKTLLAPRVLGGWGGIVTVPNRSTMPATNFTLEIAGEFASMGPTFNVQGNGIVKLDVPTTIDVTWFGAVGDGTLGGATGSDNTAAFNAAIACAQSLPQGSEVYVPPGVYDFTSTSTTVSPYSYAVFANPTGTNKGFTLRGAGAHASIMQSRLTGTNIVMLGIGNVTKTSGVSLIDMGFASNAVAGGSGTATEYLLVQLNYCLDGNVQRCAFLGGNNIQLRVLRAQGLHILDSVFHGFDNNSPSGSPAQTYCAQTGIVFSPDFNNANFTGGQATRVENCTIRDFRITKTHKGTGIHFEVLPDGTGHLKGPGSEFAVVDCDIENNDISVVENIGNNRFLHNSMESGNLQVFASAGHNTTTDAFTLSGTPLTSTAQAGTYRIIWETDAMMGGTAFTVYDPNNRVVGMATPGVLFATEINFTISSGMTTPVVGDKFFVVVFDPATASYTVPNTNNTGTGTITIEYSTNTRATYSTVSAGSYVDTVGTNGVFFLQYAGPVSGVDTFKVFDPTGQQISDAVSGATVASVGTRFQLPTNSITHFWAVTIAGSGFALPVGGQGGDSFTITALGDTLFLVGSEFSVENTLYGQNTLEMDGVQNGKFFDLVAYSYLQMNENVFQNENGSHVYCGPVNLGLMSAMRNNTGLNMRTGLYLYPGLADGTWVVENNIERSVTSQTDTAPDGATTPLVANLETLLIANTMPTTITTFLNGHNGQELTVIADESTLNTTLQNGTNVVLASGADEVMLNGSIYEFRASLDPSSSTPVWRQTGPQPRAFLQPETVSYINAGIAAGAAAPPAQLISSIDDLVIALKAASLWGKFDGLWLFAVNDLKLAGVNLVAPASSVVWHTGMSGPAVTFTPYFGVNGDGINVYGDTGLNRGSVTPPPQVTKYTSTDAALTVWFNNSTSDAGYSIGTSLGSAARIGAYVGTPAHMRGRLNDAATLNANSSSAGLSSVVRTLSGSTATTTCYRNGTALTPTDGTVSAGLPATTDVFYLFKDSAAYSGAPIALAGIGASHSATDEANLYAALQPYMHKVGLV